MESLKKNLFSHLTAKEREILSFPAKIVLERRLLIGDVLDFGCGMGKDVEILTSKGIIITGYDPHYFPEFPLKKYDTIICFYVLNVLLPEEQAQVLMDISMLLKPTGKAYFAVRRDLQHEGYRIHKIHKKPTYQCIIKLPFKSIHKNENSEIYEYQHYTTIYQGNEDISPFFKVNESRDLIVETATGFSLFDKYPVTLGHALVIPKRLVENYFDLSFKEQSACWLIINRVKQIIQASYNPDSFNVGINIGEMAGQTIPHAHIHLIPRYKGDIENPKGGIRGILPDKKEYK